MLSIMNSSFIDLPSPSNISYNWGYGSVLGMCLVFQIVTGLFLSFHYCGDVSLAFYSVGHICRDVSGGWLLRFMHLNGASLFFMFLYFHIGRGMYYGSYKFFHVWMSGSLIFILLMVTAFLGYVLPWGQMSFWGATVITNLLSAFPLIGADLVQWVWGGFSVGNATLTRFFSFHFIFPFVVVGLVILHLMFLHHEGSGNPIGVNSNLDSVSFHPYFIYKDLVGIILVLFLFLLFLFLYPNMLMDPENYMDANPMVTPIHIQPEWYFLFAYAILRSIPNKLGGVVALIFSVVVLFVLPFKEVKMRSLSNYVIFKVMFWVFVVSFMLLIWIGARPVEDPYIFIGQGVSFMYFLYFLVFMIF